MKNITKGLTKNVVYATLALLPVLALAQNTVSGLGKSVTTLSSTALNAVNSIIPVIFALAIIYFFYGVAKFILSAGDPKNAESGRSIMIYGVIAIAVMASVYGLVNLLQDTLGIKGGSVVLPKV